MKVDCHSFAQTYKNLEILQHFRVEDRFSRRNSVVKAVVNAIVSPDKNYIHSVNANLVKQKCHVHFNHRKDLDILPPSLRAKPLVNTRKGNAFARQYVRKSLCLQITENHQHKKI